MKIPALSKRRITRESKMSVPRTGRVLAAAASFLGCFFTVVSCPGEDSPPVSPRVAAESSGFAAPALGRVLTAEEFLLCSSAIVGVEEDGVPPGPGGRYPGREIAEEGVEKKIYLLKLDSGKAPDREMLELQRNLLSNQLAVMRVLGVLGEHQGMLGNKLARMENLNRDTALGLTDNGVGIDAARIDMASNLAETADVSEVTASIHQEVLEIQKQLSNIEVALDGIADTADDILDTVEDIDSGGEGGF
ncbi:MAG: hypothetical protein V1789_08500 [PVC group bacterium]